MKKLLITMLLIIGSVTMQAQQLEWHTDLTKAVKLSNKTKKPMMLFFTGSDWCGWCIRLQKEVFKTPEFETWAKGNVILVELDFPRRTPQAPELQAQNAQLQQFFNVRGYPTVWFATGKMDKEGKVDFLPIGSTGYVAGGPTVWLSVANGLIAKK